MLLTAKFNLDPVRRRTPAITAALSVFALAALLCAVVTTTADVTHHYLVRLPGDFRVEHFWDGYAQTYFHHSLLLRSLISLVVGVAAAITTYRSVRRHTPPQEPFEQETAADPQVFYGEDAPEHLVRRLREETGSDARNGLYLAPYLPLPHPAETKNILVVGASGSGKSNIIRALADQMIERKDRVLMLCVKGEVTAAFDAKDSILIAAHHRDSHAIDLAADIADSAAAIQFAADIVPASNPPFWSDCARAVLVDLILYLCMMRPGNWTAGTLLTLLAKDTAFLRERMKGIGFSASPLIESADEDGDDKTVTGILLTLRSAALANLRPLAWAWDRLPPERRFSVRRWLADDYTGKRTVIMQYSAEYAALSSLVVGNLVRTMVRTLSSPSLRNDRDRRIGLVLDEFHEIEKIDGFAHTLAVGREKGLVTILGTQTLPQIVATYGADEAAAITDLFQIKVFGRQDPGDSLDRQMKILGTRRIVRMVPNKSPLPDDKRKQLEIRETIETVGTGIIANQLGIEKHTSSQKPTSWFHRAGARLATWIGRPRYEAVKSAPYKVKAVVQCYGQVYRLEWPGTTWITRRPGNIPADWLRRIPRSGSPKT